MGGFWRAPIRCLSYPLAAVSSANEAAYLIDSRQRPDVEPTNITPDTPLNTQAAPSNECRDVILRTDRVNHDILHNQPTSVQQSAILVKRHINLLFYLSNRYTYLYKYCE